MKVLTIRALSGLSGDMMLAGLSAMTGVQDSTLNACIESFGISTSPTCSVQLQQKFVQGIAGLHAHVIAPHEHVHRNVHDISKIIQKSSLTDKAKELALNTFYIIAKAEASVHGKSLEDVHFHEVGALDSIVDICLSSMLFDILKPDLFVCSPLPLADGMVHCAHGILPVPAPAVLELLEGASVTGFPFMGEAGASGANGASGASGNGGETVTPTALALLKSFGVTFGLWPSMRIEKRALVYGTKVFENAPNGSIWAFGEQNNLG